MTRKQWKKGKATDSFPLEEGKLRQVGRDEGGLSRRRGVGQGVKIRALRERLIKGCKLTSNDAACLAPLKLRR